MHRFASYAEDGIIRLYDSRKPALAPMLSIDAQLGLIGIYFSPYVDGLLASISRDPSSVTFWSLKVENSSKQTHDLDMQMLNSNEYQDIEETVVLFNSKTINKRTSVLSDFAWLPNNGGKRSEPLYLLCNSKDPRLAVFSLSTARPSSWNTQNVITLADFDSNILMFSEITDEALQCTDADPAEYIMVLAKLGYSLNVTFFDFLAFFKY
jgi:WD40 repeat protein